MVENNQEFDVKVMVESWRKAVEVQKVVEAQAKIKLKQEELKDVAITFFIQSMKTIAEARKRKESVY